MYYFLMNLFEWQDEVLKKLGDKLDDFYLAGGTALAKFYFHHRESYDLDFFTQKYSISKVEEAVRILTRETGKTMKLKTRRDQAGRKIARGRIYEMILGPKVEQDLKIDFFQDVLPLLKPFKKVDGIDILSREDIYLRKIYAISGNPVEQDRVGKKRFLGGRQEARDLYDLYVLSSSFQNLSIFMSKHCEAWMKEGVIAWFHHFNRTEMKMGLTDIRTSNTIEFALMDRHFAKEIDRLIGGMS